MRAAAWLSTVKRLRETLSGGKADGQPCRACRHFDGDPAAIEAAFRNLASMSSGYAAVRAGDGLCHLRDLYLSGGATCIRHAPRSGTASPAIH